MAKKTPLIWIYLAHSKFISLKFQVNTLYAGM